MARKSRGLGEWAFILGVLLALVVGILGALEVILFSQETVILTLIVLGFIVGLLNIQEKEIHGFLLAAIALMTIGAGGLQQLGTLGEMLEKVVTYVKVFVGPAAFLVSLKAILDMAKK